MSFSSVHIRKLYCVWDTVFLGGMCVFMVSDGIRTPDLEMCLKVKSVRSSRYMRHQRRALVWRCAFRRGQNTDSKTGKI